MFAQLAIPTGTFLLGVILGFVLGWFVHKHVSNREIQNWERAFITMVVTVAWAISVLFDVIITGYSTPVAVHAVMGLVAGYFFEGSIIDILKRK